MLMVMMMAAAGGEYDGDDVDDGGDARPFLVGGVHCLVTSVHTYLRLRERLLRGTFCVKRDDV